MPPPSSPDYSRGMQATETLKFLLVPLRGAPLVLVAMLSVLLSGFAERYPDDVAERIAGQLAQQLER